MSLLSDKELAEMRAEAEKLLSDTCNILSKAYASDGAGGQTISWGTAAQNVSCRLVPKSSKASDMEGGRINYHTMWLVHLPYDQDVAPDQRIVINGSNYDVQSVEDAHSWRMLNQAFCRRVG